ncbi:hypothetical protein CBM2587_B70035 [Cupriavidus taiwanensis]|uniref:HTH iclR-type domain-containing protein n=1 Tax=Cupriavidus taiwanensis TaxID=164546 RepID=A0A375CAS1_9BURK|nr:hypothetical protein CBM2587_B70035 [Cupriavidus taiwanensis]
MHNAMRRGPALSKRPILRRCARCLPTGCVTTASRESRNNRWQAHGSGSHRTTEWWSDIRSPPDLARRGGAGRAAARSPGHGLRFLEYHWYSHTDHCLERTMGRRRIDPVTAMDPAADPRFITALARGLALLRSFRPTDRWLAHQELARRTGLPSATVSRLTFTLAAAAVCCTRTSRRRW